MYIYYSFSPLYLLKGVHIFSKIPRKQVLNPSPINLQYSNIQVSMQTPVFLLSNSFGC